MEWHGHHWVNFDLIRGLELCKYVLITVYDFSLWKVISPQIDRKWNGGVDNHILLILLALLCVTYYNQNEFTRNLCVPFIVRAGSDYVCYISSLESTLMVIIQFDVQHAKGDSDSYLLLWFNEYKLIFYEKEAPIFTESPVLPAADLAGPDQIILQALYDPRAIDLPHPGLKLWSFVRASW